MVLCCQPMTDTGVQVIFGEHIHNIRLLDLTFKTMLNVALNFLTRKSPYSRPGLHKYVEWIFDQ